MSMGHYVYLYVRMDEQVRRVNATKLGDETQPRPEFELVSDNSNGELPIGMGCISVNSKLYMVGGQKEQKITEDDDDDSSSEVDYVPNLKSFVLNLDAHPSIRICEDLPSMHGHKFNPLVVSVNGKFYVLARRPIYNYDKALEQPVFEVFDPAAVNGGSWKVLPRPPWTDPDQFKLGGDSMYHHFVWGHKIVFCTRAGFYIFDTDMKKWDFTDEKLSPFPIISCASAEFDGFLIAMPWDRQQLVAYRLDSDSDVIAKPCRVLDELRHVFNPPFARHEFQGFLTHLGEGEGDGGRRMCLLYAGLDSYSRWCARVANFRVSISCNDAGDRFPYAYLETLQHYDFEKFDDPARWIDSAFVMGDYLNNHDVEANARFMDACPAGSDECDYLNEHYDEANASITDTYLSGSNEGDYLNNHDVKANARFMDACPAGSDECDYLNEHDDETNASCTDTYLSGSNELSKAARTGNVGALRKLLQENPLILADFALTFPCESPLHIATKAGQLVFVKEIIKHNPAFARESNQDGFRPMDIASTFGYVEIVTELLGAGPEICRLGGRDGKTALHYAAINGRVMVIDQLLSACGASIKDVTSLGETALHLAVKFCKFEAFKCLIKWLEQLRMEVMVNWPDRDGNTVLHISVARKQLESVELLLNSSNIISSSLELNAMNSSGLTAMDIMDIVVAEGPSDIQLREVLQSAGALKACNINGTSVTTSLEQHTTNNNQTNEELLSHEEPSKDWFKDFKFQQQRDSPSDARNTLLVVATLIATVTFQAGVNPPTGFASPVPAPAPATSKYRNRSVAPIFVAPILAALSENLGSFAPTSSTWFLFANTLGLSASLSIIIYLTAGFPFQWELQISIFSMMCAYGFSTAHFQHGGPHVLLFVIASLLPFLSRWLPRWAKKAWRFWQKLIRLLENNLFIFSFKWLGMPIYETEDSA